VSDFASRLPQLLPKAVAWAEEQSRVIALRGFPLTAPGLALARTIGRCPAGTDSHLDCAAPAQQDLELRRFALE
jgi:hypothetical protein